jgi:hypothetical protein
MKGNDANARSYRTCVAAAATTLGRWSTPKGFSTTSRQASVINGLADDGGLANRVGRFFEHCT